jgi:hypothetical protein
LREVDCQNKSPLSDAESITSWRDLQTEHNGTLHSSAQPAALCHCCRKLTQACLAFSVRGRFEWLPAAPPLDEASLPSAEAPDVSEGRGSLELHFDFFDAGPRNQIRETDTRPALHPPPGIPERGGGTRRRRHNLECSDLSSRRRGLTSPSHNVLRRIG